MGGLTVRLATWPPLLDSGQLQDGEPSLAGTARPAVARMSAATAAKGRVANGDKVTVATDRGSVTIPVVVVPMAGAMWSGCPRRACRRPPRWSGRASLTQASPRPTTPSAPNSARATVASSR